MPIKNLDSVENEWTISTDITVNWGDMDSLGHVNHTVFAKWMETVRMRYFSKIGMMELYENSKIGPILARIEVDYKVPVIFPDIVVCNTCVSKIGRTSFEMKYLINSSSQQNKVVATGRVVCVMIDYSLGEPVKIPDDLRSSIMELEGNISE
ncbi:MAG: hypothetical protein CMA62_04555 [Euryarchaeota archaeon]|jgi:acyl-CoA thioester hydrolase|nr:hypothetical protein [Euryarchaeota archaeon]DAC47990.1 MAG TPA: acyl-CoA thioesterase [Candidatus Poseidoniales archaeon]HII33402.1 acyl-CoA thioesterase [Candidatus Thalassarchaeaceae archaeon]|tara:strand:- start:3720 stop:4175 length:456 start_codon:yes stop_codon:yes gene_type:complete